eukprot:CAMPEP_0196157714 /NCGR_PEP_ID=MMETSP0910-20130528/44535_1 /TAXON_ID=49265 /ORGANISM="Thalassiosira rotula, Strain GSO102" /LENGTH=358 /DNA_ID=CAMNT_0041422443 /DNA_START=124 /DNA_END=1198 /DNA_ORIENTATION=-
MSVTNSNYRSSIHSIQDDSFLNSDPLHLSAHGTLDDFDFILGADCEDSERIFANSNSSSVLDVLLSGNSRGSAAMDFQFESLSGSMNKMSVDCAGVETTREDVHNVSDDNLNFPESSNNDDGDDVNDEVMKTSTNSRRSARHRGQLHRSLGPQVGAGKQQRFQLNAVNFDPPSQVVERHLPQKQMSHGDLFQDQQQPMTEAQYTEALQKLAESMQRTEASRKQVMMQRNMLTPEQQLALSTAKERLNIGRQQQTSQQVQQHQSSTLSPHAENSCGGDLEDDGSTSRSSIMAAFFSGSRGTLTNGLEHSRKQLELYMSTVKRDCELTCLSRETGDMGWKIVGGLYDFLTGGSLVLEVTP